MVDDFSQIQLASDQKNGCKIKSLYAERKVKVFPILEPELNAISYFNTASLIAFSIGSFFASHAIGDEIHYKCFLKLPGIISIVFFLFGFCAMTLRIIAVHKIKKHHEDIP